MARKKLSTAAQVVLHNDDTATYWSVYEQRWIHKMPVASIRDEELAAMHPRERSRVVARLTHTRAGWDHIDTSHD